MQRAVQGGTVWREPRNRLGGVGGWGCANNVPGRGHLHNRLGGVGGWGCANSTGEGTWVLNHNRLGGVGGWGCANNVPGESQWVGLR